MLNHYRYFEAGGLTMQKHNDLSSDKTVVIGFTGPIGTGCSTFSKFIADTELLPQMLKDMGYIDPKNGNNLRSDILDADIIELFDKKNELEGKISRLKDENSDDKSKTNILHEISDTKMQAKSIQKGIKNLLEQRNYIYSLRFLFDDSYYKNKLRISCSSMIVSELIRRIPQDNIPEKHNDFIKLLQKSMGKHKVSKEKFEEAHEKVSRLHEHDFNINSIDKKLIPNCFTKIQLVKKDLSGESIYRDSMQDFGDNLRSTGNPYEYPTADWIKENNSTFQRNNNIIGQYIDHLIHYYSVAKKTRLFLIDSLRNPMTIKFLRKRYSSFYLISLFSRYSQRRDRIEKLLGGDFKEKNFKEQDKRDQGQNHHEIYDGFYKQNVREAVLMSDIAINNEDKFAKKLSRKPLERHKSKIYLKILRYISLILNPGCTKPTTEEMFMNMAYTMAMKSNCISRKVGAVIEGSKGYLVGAGWNDVGEGQISCGLRKIKDLNMDEYAPYANAISKKYGMSERNTDSILSKLIKKYGNANCCFCMKDELSKGEVSVKVSKLLKEGLIEEHNFEKVLSKIKIKRLEFCKALHAEENAIIQSAKIGGFGLKGAKMYATTYPCELCAKKIQQAGIVEVIYVEPYPKSLSKDLYLSDGVMKVDIRQFEGVKAYAYMDLFQPYVDRKDRQEFNLEGFKENII